MEVLVVLYWQDFCGHFIDSDWYFIKRDRNWSILFELLMTSWKCWLNVDWFILLLICHRRVKWRLIFNLIKIAECGHIVMMVTSWCWRHRDLVDKVNCWRWLLTIVDDDCWRWSDVGDKNCNPNVKYILNVGDLNGETVRKLSPTHFGHQHRCNRWWKLILRVFLLNSGHLRTLCQKFEKGWKKHLVKRQYMTLE